MVISAPILASQFKSQIDNSDLEDYLDQVNRNYRKTRS